MNTIFVDEMKKQLLNVFIVRMLLTNQRLENTKRNCGPDARDTGKYSEHHDYKETMADPYETTTAADQTAALGR